MAGAPSRGGSNATTVGMVVSIIVAVILAGVLIWLYTMQEELRARADSADAQRARIVRGGEENQLKAMFSTGPSGGTLGANVINGSKLLIAQLTGDNTMTSEAAVAGMESAVAEIRDAKRVPDPSAYTNGAGAVAIIKRLHQDYGETLDQLNETRTALAEANQNLESARQAHDVLVKKVDDFMKKVDSQVEEVQLAKANLEAQKNSEVDASIAKVGNMREALNDQRERTDEMRREIREYYASTKSLLDEQQKVIADIKGPEPLDARDLASARKPIGRILRTIPGESVVHINMGRQDGIALGMTFAVYSENSSIPVNGRGKASLEVVSVNKRTSECRIVSPPSPDDPILEGDGVNNILLARTRGKQQTFVVVGDFDVDFDGQPDPRGRESIIRHIERKGGKVLNEVTPLTDFLVVGTEPRGQDVLAGLGTPPGVIGLGDGPVARAKPAADADESMSDDDGDTSDDEETVDDDSSDDGDDWGDDWGDDEEKTDDDGDADGDDSDDDSDDDAGSDDGDDDDDDWDSPVIDGGDGGPTGMHSIKRTQEIDPTVPTLMRRYRNEADRYRDSLWRARNFSVPVLTQEQFFNYVGIEGTRADIRRLQE